MKFQSFLEEISKTHKVNKNEENRWIITKDEKSLELDEYDNIDYNEFNKYFDSLPKNTSKKLYKDYNIGRDDLFPSLLGEEMDFKKGKMQKKGMYIGEDHPLFGERKIAHSDDESDNVPPFAKYDPVVPSKSRKKGEPDPDHFRKPGNGGNDLF